MIFYQVRERDVYNISPHLRVIFAILDSVGLCYMPCMLWGSSIATGLTGSLTAWLSLLVALSPQCALHNTSCFICALSRDSALSLDTDINHLRAIPLQFLCIQSYHVKIYFKYIFILCFSQLFWHTT